MSKANCLTRALDQWNEDKEEYKLFYNSNHVISVDHKFCQIYSVGVLNYSSLESYGFTYFAKAFKLTKKYRFILQEYLNQE